MVKKILNSHDPRLRVKSKPIIKLDKKVLLLIKDLKDTLSIQKDPEGVGLAAPQIGKNVQVFLIKNGSNTQIIINPVVLSISKKEDLGGKKAKRIMEGCLSLPHFYGPLRRAREIKIKYMTEEGEEVEETFLGITAQIVQHEIDHLNGVLFIDHLLEQKKPLYEHINGEWEKVELI